MHAQRIEELLAKNGVQQSKELSLALEEILNEYSKDKGLATNVDKNIKADNTRKNILKTGRP